MAVRPLTAIRKGNWLHFSWDTVTDSDTCEPLYLNHNVSDMFIEVSGTFSSAAITLNGGVTNTPTVALVDPAGTAISVTAAGGSAIRDAWPFMAPVTTSGSSSDVDIEIRMKVVK